MMPLSVKHLPITSVECYAVVLNEMRLLKIGQFLL